MTRPWDDDPFVFVAVAILGLCGLHLLHTWMIGKQLDLIVDLRADVDWLKENTVANDREVRA